MQKFFLVFILSIMLFIVPACKDTAGYEQVGKDTITDLEPTTTKPTSPANPTTPSNPKPSDPTPSNPTPSNPTPSDPTPSDPTPSNPTPSDPTPSDPTPSDPTPIDLVHPRSGTGYDVFLVIGQSNTHFGKGFDPDIDFAIPEIKQLGRGDGRNLKILPAIEPLDHYSKRKDRIGFALSFAKEYRSHTNLGSREILLIPGGRGSTSFLGGNWRKGDELYEDAVYRTNYILKAFPNSKLIAVLWHQGESDYFNYAYEQDLDAFITDMRADLYGDQTKVPFILGGMVSRWVNDGSEQVKSRRRTLQNIISNTVNRIGYTGFADSEHPAILKYNKLDELIHFDAVGQRELGRRYFKAYNYAIHNDLRPKRPEMITNVKAIGKNGNVVVKWFAPPDNHDKISGYQIHFRRKGTISWENIYADHMITKIGGLENGVTYEIKVSAKNSLGLGRLSEIVEATPHATYSKCILHLTFDQIDFSNESGRAVVFGDSGFRIWNGDYRLKWFIAESRATTNRIRTLAEIGGDYTKMLWFKLTSMVPVKKDQHLISSISGVKHAFLVTADGRLSAGHNYQWNEVQSPISAIKTNIWYHGAVAYSGLNNKLKLYLNGNKIAEAATTEIGIADMQIGNYITNGTIGQIADVRVYSGATLTDQEIQTIYVETSPK